MSLLKGRVKLISSDSPKSKQSELSSRAPRQPPPHAPSGIMLLAAAAAQMQVTISTVMYATPKMFDMDDALLHVTKTNVNPGYH